MKEQAERRIREARRQNCTDKKCLRPDDPPRPGRPGPSDDDDDDDDVDCFQAQQTILNLIWELEFHFNLNLFGTKKPKPSIPFPPSPPSSHSLPYTVIKNVYCNEGWHKLRGILRAWQDPEFYPQNGYIKIFVTFAIKIKDENQGFRIEVWEPKIKDLVILVNLVILPKLLNLNSAFRPFVCPHLLHALNIVKYDAWITWPERPMGAKDKWRGPKYEVGLYILRI